MYVSLSGDIIVLYTRTFFFWMEPLMAASPLAAGRNG